MAPLARDDQSQILWSAFVPGGRCTAQHDLLHRRDRRRHHPPRVGNGGDTHRKRLEGNRRRRARTSDTARPKSQSAVSHSIFGRPAPGAGGLSPSLGLGADGRHATDALGIARRLLDLTRVFAVIVVITHVRDDEAIVGAVCHFRLTWWPRLGFGDQLSPSLWHISRPDHTAPTQGSATH